MQALLLPPQPVPRRGAAPALLGFWGSSGPDGAALLLPVLWGWVHGGWQGGSVTEVPGRGSGSEEEPGKLEMS